MGNVKNTSIIGDISISRNASIGGDAVIQGGAIVKKNLKVEGWLDARNIKGPNKGLFTTEEKLNAAYPRPMPGWWAVVGTTLPAQIYVSDKGQWVCQEGSSYNPGVDIGDLSNIGDYSEAMSNLESEVQKLSEKVDDMKTVTDSVDGLSDTVAALSGKVDSVSEAVDGITAKIGKAGGIAALDAYGRIPQECIPGSVDDVKDFAGTVSGVSVNSTTANYKSTDDGCAVMYNSDTKRFVMRVGSDDSGSARIVGGYTPKATYYNNWRDAAYFGGEADMYGWMPMADKLYVCTTSNSLYRWDGSDLVTIGAEGAVETVASDFLNVNALCGDYGYDLSSAIDAILENAPDKVTPGLVFTYRTVDDEWLTKQFVGTVASEFDKANTSLFKDFDGDSYSINLSDLSEEDLAVLRGLTQAMSDEEVQNIAKDIFG
jgi:hypothetical protein